MKKLNNKEVEAYCREWKECPDKDIDTLFEQFFDENATSIISENDTGVLGFENQFNRIRAIDFDLVHADFVDRVTGVRSAGSQGNASLSVELAINKVSNGDKNISIFQMYFRTEVGGEVAYWGNDPFNVGSHEHARCYKYGVMSQTPSDHQMSGVSTQLKNQLSYNWGLVPFPNLSDLFYAESFPKDVLSVHLSKVKNMEQFDRLALCKGWVRGHRYQITGENLDALYEAIISGSSYVRIVLGANLTDLLIGKDIFTIIIEVRKEENSESSDFPPLDNSIANIEFVQACPPFCGGGDG